MAKPSPAASTPLRTPLRRAARQPPRVLEERGPSCVNTEASNYDLAAALPLATKDDGSCIFAMPGCVYEAASNYDPKPRRSTTANSGWSPICPA